MRVSLAMRARGSRDRPVGSDANRRSSPEIFSGAKGWIVSFPAACPASAGKRSASDCPALESPPFGAVHHRTWLDGIAGRGPRLATAHDAVRGMQVVEAIRRSSDACGACVALAEAVESATG